MTDVGGIAADALYHHGIPWLAKKTVEIGCYGASELMRDKKLQKKALDYGMKKLTPFVYDTAGKALDQLSTKVRPDKKYKTDRKDLDGSGIIDSLLTSGVKGSPWQVDLKKGINLITDPELWAPVNKMPVAVAKKLVQYYKDSYKEPKKNGYTKSYNSFVKEMGWGKGIDIHKWIGKLPNRKLGGLLVITSIWELIILLINNLNTILKLVKFGDGMLCHIIKQMKFRLIMTFVMIWERIRVNVTEK